jgi:hypothetical protein
MRELAATDLRSRVVTITVVRSTFGSATERYGIAYYLDHVAPFLNQDVGVGAGIGYASLRWLN